MEIVFVLDSLILAELQIFEVKKLLYVKITYTPIEGQVYDKSIWNSYYFPISTENLTKEKLESIYEFFLEDYCFKSGLEKDEVSAKAEKVER